ncbi:MAG: transcriptional regulator NrdR [Armatimonadota bacterium]|nr:transcriptional regulator NrdR [Armatimonadota bacterium]MDR7519272.1 transcriptional regulator NrdR [Armatimonadota bacterium]MDR7549742.1 transcriptional regulator NrdR [Armatimonadota bacterium]
MRCPVCGHDESKVLDSRPVLDGRAIRRRRECLACERRFTTYERPDLAPVMVVKRDGRREPFDRAKVLAGVTRACGKRPLSMESLDALVDDVEREIRQLGVQEVPSATIGELVMDRLRRLDDVAYVRFASEHRRFRDIDSIAEEIETLKERKRREDALRDQVPLITLPDPHRAR